VASIRARQRADGSWAYTARKMGARSKGGIEDPAHGNLTRQNVGANWSPVGLHRGSNPAPPSVYNFTQSNVSPDPSLAFNQALTSLLTGLQACWTRSAKPSIGAMFELQSLGVGLIQNGIRPEFLWAPPSTGD
jgi:hypothetical protein